MDVTVTYKKQDQCFHVLANRKPVGTFPIAYLRTRAAPAFSALAVKNNVSVLNKAASELMLQFRKIETDSPSKARHFVSNLLVVDNIATPQRK